MPQNMINTTNSFPSASKSEGYVNKFNLNLDKYTKHIGSCSSSRDIAQTVHLSDDNTTSTKSDITTVTSFTFSTTTEEEEAEAEERKLEERPIDRESTIHTKHNEIVFFQKRNESLERDNKRVMQHLSMREQEVSALVARCDSQEKVIMGMRDAKVMSKEIEQLNIEMKRKDVAVGRLNEELTRTKKEATAALEEEKKVEVLKCKEISLLQSTMNDLNRKTDSLDDEVVKLKAEIVSKDIELKDAQSTIISMTNSRIEREENLRSLHLQAQLLFSSIDKSRKDHWNKVVALKLEIDQFKTCSENEAIAFQQKVTELEQLEKAAAEKDEIIKRQKKYCTNLENELGDRSLLIDEPARQKKELEDKLRQTHVLVVELQKGSQSLLRETQLLILSIGKSKISSEVVVSKLDFETIEQQKGSSMDMEKELAERAFIIDEIARQKKELEDQLNRTHDLVIELGESQINHNEMQLLVPSIDDSKIDHLEKVATMRCKIDQLKICSEKEAILFQQNGLEFENLEKVAVEKDEILEQQKGYSTDTQKDLAERTFIIDEAARQKKELEDELKQIQYMYKDLQEESKLRLQEMNEFKGKCLQLNNKTTEKKDNHKKKLQFDVKIYHGKIGMKNVEVQLMEPKKQNVAYAGQQNIRLLAKEKIDQKDQK